MEVGVFQDLHQFIDSGLQGDLRKLRVLRWWGEMCAFKVLRTKQASQSRELAWHGTHTHIHTYTHTHTHIHTHTHTHDTR